MISITQMMSVLENHCPAAIRMVIEKKMGSNRKLKILRHYQRGIASLADCREVFYAPVPDTAISIANQT